ncbi:MAG: hypothetical protein QM541_01370 [Flavobacterium sp.]|nr:hypothetical protein [Flavobacterium sp.]
MELKQVIVSFHLKFIFMSIMEPQQIALQIEAIKDVAEKALASQEYAINFLKKAGLWEDEKKQQEPSKPNVMYHGKSSTR